MYKNRRLLQLKIQFTSRNVMFGIPRDFLTLGLRVQMTTRIREKCDKKEESERDERKVQKRYEELNREKKVYTEMEVLDENGIE